MPSLDLATPREIATLLGGNLRAQRLAQNLRQDELAARAGVAVGTVRNLEGKGQASLESLVRVVSSLGLAAEFDGLFAPKVRSIAAMEKAASPRIRARASRRS